MISVTEPTQSARFAIIWLHGLGASGEDMQGLQTALQIADAPIRHVFMTAPTRSVTINNGFAMPAWYDIVGQSLTDREDEHGIIASESSIVEQIEQQVAKGIPYKRIFVAGFSQGGAMALFTGLRCMHQLAGIVAMSAYLPLAQQCFDQTPRQSQTTPVFMAIGDNDPIVLPAWSLAAKALLLEKGQASVRVEHYPMEHTVCLDEIRHLREWLLTQLASDSAK